MRKDNAALIERLSHLEPSTTTRIWHFGAPIHMNLGDQAQLLCIRSWLANNYPDFEVIEITSNEFNGGARDATEAIRSIIGPDDIITMQGGHTMNAIHPDASFHRAAASAFPSHRIVYFPTSLPSPSKSGKVNLVSEVGEHQRTLLLARDKLSYDLAVKHYANANVRLSPDIVTTLIGTTKPREQRRGILLCLRNDGEKYYSYDAIEALTQKLKRYGRVNTVDTSLDMTGRDVASVDIAYEIEKMLEDFSKYQIVITDRYHGVIFSRIAETPTITLRTTDRKVLEGSRWFVEEGDSGTAVASTIESVPMLVESMMEQFPNGKAAPCFAKPYFDGLRQVIDEL